MTKAESLGAVTHTHTHKYIYRKENNARVESAYSTELYFTNLKSNLLKYSNTINFIEKIKGRNTFVVDIKKADYK